MITKISDKISFYLVNRQNKEDYQQEILSFGIEAIIYKIIHFGVAILIGAMFGRIIDILIFHIFYQKIRTYTGGYHAKTNFLCFLSSCGIAVVTLSFWSFCSQKYYIIFIVTILVISIPIILILSPIEDKNKPLDEIEQKVYRKKGRFYLFVEVIAIMILWIADFLSIALVGSTALLVLTIMLVLGKNVNAKNNIKVVENES